MLGKSLCILLVVIHSTVNIECANDSNPIRKPGSYLSLPYSFFSSLGREKRTNHTIESHRTDPTSDEILHITHNTSPSGPYWPERVFGALVDHFIQMFGADHERMIVKDNQIRKKEVDKLEIEKDKDKKEIPVFEVGDVKTALLEGRTWDEEKEIDDDFDDSEEDEEEEEEGDDDLDKLTSPREESMGADVCHMLNHSLGLCQPTLYCMLQQPQQVKFAMCAHNEMKSKQNQISEHTHASLPSRVCCPPITVNDQVLKQKLKDWIAEVRTELFAVGLPKHPDGRCGMVLVDVAHAKDNELLRSNASDKSNKRIVHGRTAQVGQIPWMVQIFFRSQLICGGSIISKLHVLTAAHCFSQSRSPFDYTILYGHVVAGNGTIAQVASITIPPRYNPPAIYGDLALLKLTFPIELSETTQPVCLPGKKMLNKLMIGQSTTVAGFGDTHFQGPPARILQKVDVKVIEASFCNHNYERLVESSKRFPEGIDASLICAGRKHGKRDSCTGDSGGPLTIEYGKVNYLVGIVSFGYRCALPKFPGVYTAVAHYNNWIFDNIIP